MGEVEKEPVAGMLFNKCSGFSGVGFCQVTLVNRSSNFDSSIAIQIERLHIIAVEGSVETVKSHVIGQGGTAITQMPFTHHPGRIACGAKHVRQGNLV